MSVMAWPKVVALELEVLAFSLSELDRMGGRLLGTLGDGLVFGLGAVLVVRLGMGMGGGLKAWAGCGCAWRQ